MPFKMQGKQPTHKSEPVWSTSRAIEILLMSTEGRECLFDAREIGAMRGRGARGMATNGLGGLMGTG